MNACRSCTFGELRADRNGWEFGLSSWQHRVRESYGVTLAVADPG